MGQDFPSPQTQPVNPATRRATSEDAHESNLMWNISRRSATTGSLFMAVYAGSSRMCIQASESHWMSFWTPCCVAYRCVLRLVIAAFPSVPVSTIFRREVLLNEFQVSTTIPAVSPDMLARHRKIRGHHFVAALTEQQSLVVRVYSVYKSFHGVSSVSL